MPRTVSPQGETRGAHVYKVKQMYTWPNKTIAAHSIESLGVLVLSARVCLRKKVMRSVIVWYFISLSYLALRAIG